MIITWLGHACFALENSTGHHLVTDPFHPRIGYLPPVMNADVVTISHSHSDHNAPEQVLGDPIIITYLANEKLYDFYIKGINTYHDNVQGTKRGTNIINIIETDGLRIGHCGDLGHLLDQKTLTNIGELDILFVPVGGVYTLDGAQASDLVQQLKPQLTVPMHYKTPMLNIQLEPVDTFLSYHTSYHALDTNTINITKESLADFAPVLVFDYPH